MSRKKPYPVILFKRYRISDLTAPLVRASIVFRGDAQASLVFRPGSRLVSPRPPQNAAEVMAGRSNSEEIMTPENNANVLVYSYSELAKVLCCSPKTLQNLVSSGRLPRPVKTLVGPRFLPEVIDSIINPPAAQKARRKPGRPRIADTKE